MRRTARRLSDYWQFGVTSRTQPFALGDVLPRSVAQINPTVATSVEAASITGNASLPAYTTETMFDVKKCLAMERTQTKTFRGVDQYKVPPLSSGDAQQVFTTLSSIPAVSWDGLLWENLFKDFPNLRKPFNETLRQEFVAFYIAVVKVADDEAAVAAIAEPFLLKHLETNFISPPTWWRISETLCNAIDGYTAERNRYEKRAVREVIERVTKISLNTLSKQAWTSPDDAVNPIFMNLGGFRAWHDAGNW